MKLVFLIVLLSLSLFSKDYKETINNIIEKTKNIEKNRSQDSFQNNIFAKNYPLLAGKLLEAKKQAEKISKHDEVIYIFISSSIPRASLEKYIIESGVLSHYYGIPTKFVMQGEFDKEFVKKMESIRKNIQKYQYAKVLFQNAKIRTSPLAFKKLNIKKIPVIALAHSTGLIHDAQINYIARGDIGLANFFSLIVNSGGGYESYLDTILSI